MPAEDKLVEVEIHRRGLRQTMDRVSYQRAWCHCVDAIEEFWSRFYAEGKDHFSNFEPWIGPINKSRRKDPVLRYLIEARHQNQHGLFTLSWSQGHYRVGEGFSGLVRNVVIYKDGSYEAAITPNGSNQQEDLVRHVGGKPILPSIHNARTKETFCPPSSHMGQTLPQINPTAAIDAGLSYYKKLLDNAREKFLDLKNETQP